MKTLPIFLDHSATTPVHPEVIEAMLPYWTEGYGNPASSHHFGRSANVGLESARRSIAELIGAKPQEIIFTGCGSEADNFAIKGAMLAARASKRGNHMITSVIEHEAVLQSAEQLRDLFDFDLTVVGVNSFGEVNLDEIKEAIRPDTVLISIMAANNEIGTIQPFEEIGALAREHGILFHSDAVQAAPFFKWNMAEQPIDLFCMAPHKFYGPKGVGVLYIRDGVELVSHISGGSQEFGKRAGTVNVPFAVGAGKAFEIAMAEQDSYQQHCQTLRDQLISGLMSAVPAEHIRLTGHPENRLPHHASFALRQISGNDILMQLDLNGIAGSSGSACSSGNPKPSAILEALGLESEWTRGGLRLTLGKSNTAEEIEHVIQAVPPAIDTLLAFIGSYRS